MTTARTATPAASLALPRLAPRVLPRVPPVAVRLVAVFVGWTLVAMLVSEQSYLVLRGAGRTPSYWSLLRVSLIGCWMWAAYTPVIGLAARRLPLVRPGWWTGVPLHLALLVLFTALDAGAELVVRPLIDPTRAPRPLGAAMIAHAVTNAVCYLVIALAVNAADAARQSRARQAEARALEAQLATAQLEALRAQLHPHFLFNTLNTIAEQLHTDPRGADRMITRLATLLRATFERPDAHEVPLAGELATLGAYLDIMLVRFGDRLVVDVDAAPETLDAAVPPLLLQPLVENAIRHGIEPAERGGRVEVHAWRDGEGADAWLVLEVLDDGAGPAADGATRDGAGVGLRNTRARLQRLYGDRQRLTLAPRAGGGTAVTIAIPWTTSIASRAA